MPRLHILYQPAPSTSLDASQSRVEQLLHSIQATIRMVNCLCKRTARRLPTTLVLRRQILPEQAMIEVSTAVKVDEWLKSDLRCNIAGGLGGLHLLGEFVVRGYVGVVVFAVMKLHNLARDGWLERIIVI